MSRVKGANWPPKTHRNLWPQACQLLGFLFSMAQLVWIQRTYWERSGALSSCEWTNIAVTDLLVHIDWFSSDQTEDLCTGLGRIQAIRISTIAPALLSLWGWKARKSYVAIPGTHLHFSLVVPTTFQAAVCVKQQPFCHNLKISSYEPIVESPETIHQGHLVTRWNDPRLFGLADSSAAWNHP